MAGMGVDRASETGRGREGSAGQHAASLDKEEPDTVLGNPVRKTGPLGIPQSLSCGTVIGGFGAAAQGDGDGGEQRLPFSPASSRSGNLSEPRNYAPRAGADSSPPRFDPRGILQGAAQQQQQGQQPVQQQGAGPHRQLDAQASVFSPAAAAAAQPTAATYAHSQPLVRLQPQAGAQSSGPIALNARLLAAQAGVALSPELSRLVDTASGLPLFSTALAPGNFPFIEGPRLAQPIPRGVLKLKNVSEGAPRGADGTQG